MSFHTSSVSLSSKLLSSSWISTISENHCMTLSKSVSNKTNVEFRVWTTFIFNWEIFPSKFLIVSLSSSNDAVPERLQEHRKCHKTSVTTRIKTENHIRLIWYDIASSHVNLPFAWRTSPKKFDILHANQTKPNVALQGPME